MKSRHSTSKPDPTHKATRPAAKEASPAHQPAVTASDPLSLAGAIEQPELATPEMILRLQRVAGNRAVQRLLASRTVQAKLTVGPAGDEYEQEADRVAGQVMHMPEPAPAATVREDDREGQVQRQPLAATVTPVAQRPAPSPESTQEQSAERSPGAGFEAGATVERRLAARQGLGQPLNAGARAFMESRFGADFSGVRVHTDRQAVQLSRDLSARAFTHGSDIYFGDGGLPAGAQGGQQLLAHELTHVVQQGGARAAGGRVQRSARPGVIQRFSLTGWFKKKFGKKQDAKEAAKGGEEGAEAPKEAVKPDEMLADSVEYERRLGRYGFGHSLANNAAKAMLDKMATAMVGELKEDDEAQGKQLVEMFGKDAPESAGQVGQNLDAIVAVIKEGNLRERLTAMYNAMFGGFKDYLKTAISKSKWSELEAKGFNVTKMKRRKRQMLLTPGARDLYRNPYGKYDRKKLSTYQDFGNTRSSAEGASDRTAGELEQGGLGLSEREKAVQFPDKQGGDVSGEKVKWKEGANLWKMNEANPWVKQAKNTLHMPVVAGPSGTLQRLFQVWEWLGKPVPAADWRLAVMAWMLTANDHTFHEMMMTAVEFGLPYRAGQKSYMDVQPLTVWDLRQNVAKDGLFPHEQAFKRKFEAGGMKTIMGKRALKDATSDLEDADDQGAGALSPPAAAAIQLYTSFGYLLLNPAKRGGPQAEAMITKAIKEKDELKQFRKPLEEGTLNVQDLIKETLEVVPMLESALEMLPDWQGKLYRGIATNSKYTFVASRTFAFDKFGSATEKETVAKKFADDMATGKYKYIMELDVTAGKDLRGISDYASEDEVLLPPGSSFKITKRQAPAEGDPYYRVFMTQTGRGGGMLDLGQRPAAPEVDSEDDEAEPPVTLKVYDAKDESSGYDILTKDQDYIIDNPEDLGDGWTKFNSLKVFADNYCKTAEYAVFKNPAPKKAKVEAEHDNPLKGILTPPSAKPIEFFSLSGGNAEDLAAPIGIEIMDENYPKVEGWQQVQVKLADGRFGMIYADALMANFKTTAKSAQAVQPVVEPPKDDPGAKYDHIKDGKHSMTLPAGKKIVAFPSFDSHDTEELTMEAEQPARLTVTAFDKKSDRCKIELMGKSGIHYIALVDVFDETGKPSPNLEHGGKKAVV